ncbi:unnamed protein product, partial [Effrenium voratum]
MFLCSCRLWMRGPCETSSRLSQNEDADAVTGRSRPKPELGSHEKVEGRSQLPNAADLAPDKFMEKLHPKLCSRPVRALCLHAAAGVGGRARRSESSGNPLVDSAGSVPPAEPSHVGCSAAQTCCVAGQAWRGAMELLGYMKPMKPTEGEEFSGAVPREALPEWGQVYVPHQRQLNLMQANAELEGPREQRGDNRYRFNVWAPTMNQAVISCGEASVWQPALAAVSNAWHHGVFRPQIYTFNPLATACLRSHSWSWGLLMLREAQLRGLRPDAFSAAAAFSSCQTEVQWKVTAKILQHLRVGEEGGVDVDLVVLSSAMTSMEKGGKWREAIGMFNSIDSTRLQLNVVSCSAAIAACEAGGCWVGAFALLQRMRQAAMRANTVSFHAALKSARARWPRGVEILSVMQREGVQWTVLACEDLMKACEE